MSRVRRWFQRCLNSTPSTTTRRRAARTSLGCDSLEGRDLMSASPLPVLLVIADQQDFYYREYSDTRTGIESKGISVVVGATTTNPSTPHAGTGQPLGSSGVIVPDVALASVNPDDYSAIAFVGGWGASMYQYAYNDPNFDGVNDNYYSNDLYNADPNLHDGQIAEQKVVVNNLINEFLSDDKPVAAICHGVTVLAWARVDGVSPIAGKNVAVPHLEGTPDQWYNNDWRNGGYLDGQRQQVLDNGGLPTAYSGAHGLPGTADDVIVDGQIITGENPDSASLFGQTIGDEVLADLPPAEPPPPANQAPTAQDAQWSVPENTAAGTIVGIVGATDPDAGDALTFSIVSGNTGGAFALDPTTGQVTVANPAALDFETNPTFDLTLRVTDQGGLEAFAQLTIEIQNVHEGPVSLVDGNLVVNGTSGADTIYLWSAAADNQAFAWINGESHGPFTLPAGGRVIVYGGDGNDQIFATDLRIAATIYGGAGHDMITGGTANDRLDGGAGVDRVWGNAGDDLLIGGEGNDFLDGHEGNDVLLGGDGDDVLDGGNGRDLLLGGLGADLIRGGSGDDALFGFATAYDNDDSALAALQGVWVGSGDIDERIALLTAPTGTSIRLGETAYDDGETDTFLGGDGDDFGFAGPQDKVHFLYGNDRVRNV